LKWLELYLTPKRYDSINREMIVCISYFFYYALKDILTVKTVAFHPDHPQCSRPNSAIYTSKKDDEYP